MKCTWANLLAGHDWLFMKVGLYIMYVFVYDRSLLEACSVYSWYAGVLMLYMYINGLMRLGQMPALMA